MWWRKRRHAKVEAVGGKCASCPAVTTHLDVHHLNYDRLGEERDSDLEVLCRDCHQKRHAEESAKQNLTTYVLLAFETLRLDQPTTHADMRYALEARCRDLHLPIDQRINRAIGQVFEPAPPPAAVEFHQTRESPAFGHQESIEILRKLNAYPLPIRSMPDASKPIAPAARRSTEPFNIDCQYCGPSQGRRSWSVAQWVLCLKCRQWNKPPTRTMQLTRESETAIPQRQIAAVKSKA